MSFKLDRVISVDITAMFIDDKNELHPRKIHITQIPNATIKGLGYYSDEIQNCESFVNDISIEADIALCETQELNETTAGDKCNICGSEKYMPLELGGNSPFFCIPTYGTAKLMCCANCGSVQIDKETLDYVKTLEHIRGNK